MGWRNTLPEIQEQICKREAELDDQIERLMQQRKLRKTWKLIV